MVRLNCHADLFDADVPVRERVCRLPPFRGRVALQVIDPSLARTGTLAGRPRR